MNRRTLLSLGSALIFTIALPVLSQVYPSRTIKVYQGFAAGGNADSIARAMGVEMGKAMNQTFIVEAQTGAGGTIAANTVARSNPDGYTLLLATGGHAVAGALYNALPYRTIADFEMISTVTYFPFLIVVNANSKFRTFREVVTLAQSQPESVAYGTAGIGSTHHLAGELLVKMTKASMLHVPYRGDAASMTALLAGDVAFIIAPPSAVMANIQAGKLQALATTGPDRWSGLPNVPTLAEQGVPGYDVRSWAGFLAPAGTPRPIVERLNAEIQKALPVSTVRQRLEDMGGEAKGSTPEEMKLMVARELEKWAQVVTDAKIPRQ